MSDYRALWFVAGVTVGGAAGAAVAVLLTPARGEEARQQLNRWGKDLGTQGKEAAQGALVRSKEAVARGRDKLTSETEKLRSRLRSDGSQVEAVSGEEASSAARMA